jgi:hypothetical protein
VNVRADVTPSAVTNKWVAGFVVSATTLVWAAWALAALLDARGVRRALVHLTWAVAFVGMCDAYLLGAWLADALMIEAVQRAVPQPFWLATFVSILVSTTTHLPPSPASPPNHSNRPMQHTNHYI